VEGAMYQYDGFGNRVGKVEGTPVEPILPTEKIKDLSLNPMRQIDDVLDLTKEYHNMLQRNEDDNITSFTWDNNVLSVTGSEGIHNYFLDELGGSVRLIDWSGRETQTYSYNEFGQELNKNQKVVQPFGYMGYQYDQISKTYYAQAREYNPYVSRFVSEDVIKGNGAYPFTLNQYIYCWNQPIDLVDNDGEWPTVVIGALVGTVVGGVGSIISDVASGDDIDWKKAGKNAAKGAVTGAVIGTGVGAVAALASTAGVSAGAAVAGYGITTGISAISNGVANCTSSGVSYNNFVNGFAGGATNATIAVVGSMNTGTLGGAHLSNALGGLVGSFLTDNFNNWDSTTTKKDMDDIIRDAWLAAGTQGFFSFAGGAYTSPFINNLGGGMLTNLQLAFWNSIYSFTGTSLFTIWTKANAKMAEEC